MQIQRILSVETSTHTLYRFSLIYSIILKSSRLSLCFTNFSNIRKYKTFYKIWKRVNNNWKKLKTSEFDIVRNFRLAIKFVRRQQPVTSASPWRQHFIATFVSTREVRAIFHLAGENRYLHWTMANLLGTRLLSPHEWVEAYYLGRHDKGANNLSKIWYATLPTQIALLRRPLFSQRESASESDGR